MYEIYEDFSVSLVFGLSTMQWLTCCLVEADARHFEARADASRLTTHGDLSNLDITLSYDSSSDFDPFASVHSDNIYTPPDYGVNSQSTDLRGIGQWTDKYQENSWSSPQSPPSMDVSKESDFDLVRIHDLAAASAFEEYFKSRKREEGTLNFQMYALLP